MGRRLLLPILPRTVLLAVGGDVTSGAPLGTGETVDTFEEILLRQRGVI